MKDELKAQIFDRIPDIRDRWGYIKPKWPWYFAPCKVHILFYADFPSAYDGSSFDGLKQVIATLNSEVYFWVDFEITLANRGNDSSADPGFENKNLDELDCNSFDEIWFFGFWGLPSGLSQNELKTMTDFMDNGGGVLVTGDHEDLGANIASAIPRAGKMRKWQLGDAPFQSGPGKHSTLREGATPGYQFNDQSDDVPQPLRLSEYPLSTFHYPMRTMPHPIMCSPFGPINVFPDHMHEGHVIVPNAFPASEWPSKFGYQPKPEVVAWGSIVEPGLHKTGQEFGVVGVYDGHRVDVGRAVADATWHHWFDINLIGNNGTVGGTTGFNASTSGKDALSKIEAYFLNVAVWLAPPDKQRCMRNHILWHAMWVDPLIMISFKTPVLSLGKQAKDALGKSAPQCTIIRWIWEIIPLPARVKIEDFLRQGKLFEDDDRGPYLSPIPPFLEEWILGCIIRKLSRVFHEQGTFPERIDVDEINKLISSAFDESSFYEALELAGKALDFQKEGLRELMGNSID